MPSMNKLREIATKVRKCCKCGRSMHWHDFVFGNIRAIPENYFEYDMLLEIWDNPIFIMYCCWCYSRHLFFKCPNVSELFHD